MAAGVPNRILFRHGQLVHMESFRRLKVWQRAHKLTIHVYRLAATLPVSERFGLAAQLRRAAASVAANIAEGCGRRNSFGGNGELIRFLHIAMGSAMELEYHLLLAHDVGLITDAQHRVVEDELRDLQRMLARFISRLRELDRFQKRRRPRTATS
ncbi:MAG: four helix bundle protein [Gemmatimonadota bacterium]|nr:four helix bundle protein [Gemmatimonadota bacterium]